MANSQSSTIHPTAQVDPSAELASDVQVGPYALIGPRVVIGAGSRIEGHAVIASDTRMGERNIVYHHTVLGSPSQDKKFHGETALLEIGDENIFREFVTVNRATGKNESTRIGNHCLVLAYSHIAHNCILGDHVVLSNCAQVAGEVVLEDYTNIGGMVGIHQLCHIGAHAIVGACSKVTQDILPFLTADGHPARPHGLNLIGLKRHHFSKATISHIKKAYRQMFQEGVRLEEALEIIERDHDDCPETARMVAFTRASMRSLSRPKSPPKETA